MSYYDDASLVLIPSGVKTSKIYSQKPTSGTGDLTFSRASTATRTNASGVIESVASNVPRLDYLNSSCPRLLLEPQRTNTATFSESFNNAAWVKLNATITANAATSPDGYANADKIIEDTANGVHVIRNAQTYSSGVTYTNSCFLKADTRSVAWIIFGGNILGLPSIDYRRGIFDLSSGTILAAPTGGSAKIEDYGNGWYRCSVTISVVTGGNANLDINLADPSDPSNNIYTGDGVSGLFVWGAQAEVGSYPSSYIPTTTAAVTRIADAASKTGVSSLIGQTEGTLFADVNLDTRQSFTYFNIAPNLASPSSYIGIGITNNVIQAEVIVSTIAQARIILNNSATGRFKMAFAYKQNDFTFYMNGALIGTDTSGTVPACSEIGLYNYSQVQMLKYNQAALFTTRLPDATLAQMTTL